LLLFTPTVVVYIADYIYKQNEFELQVWPSLANEPSKER
jgi:hypothetical protein